MKTTADNSYQGVRLKNANVILQAAQLDSDGVYAKAVLENKDSFLNNTARVLVELWSSYNVSGGTFSGNTTGQRSGGSLFFVAKSAQAILSLKSVTITNNVTLSKQAAVAWVQKGGALHIGGTTLIEGNTASLSYGNIKSSGGYVRINSGTIKPITANGELVNPEDNYTALVKAGGNILIAKKAKIEGKSLGLD